LTTSNGDRQLRIGSADLNAARPLKLARLRLRGAIGTRDEFHLAATAQNLRKLAKLIAASTLIPVT
jgi:hypothetical protein